LSSLKPDCQQPFTVTYADGFLEDIRSAAAQRIQGAANDAEGLDAILFGVYEAGKVHISTWRAIPSDLLRTGDAPESALSRLLADLDREAGLKGLLRVGWLRSRRQPLIRLSPEEESLHNRYFPHPWQLVLILKPRFFGPTRAGIFMRDASGSLNPNTPTSEFVIEPAKAVSRFPETARTAASIFERAHTKESTGASGFAPLAVRPLASTAPSEAPVPLPRFLTNAERAGEAAGRPLWRRLPWRGFALISLLTVIAAALSGMATRILFVPANEPSLELGLNVVGDVLQVSWSRSAPVIQNATGGQVRIVDGPAQRVLPLTRDGLLGGALVYTKASHDVEIRLIVEQAGGRKVEAAVRYLGAQALELGQPTLAELREQVEELTKEREALHEQIDKLTTRAQIAERELQKLTNK